jgi:hypothetical protein
MKLIFIHGRSQQGKNSQELIKIWRGAWDEGLHADNLVLTTTIEIAMPFYGDKLFELMNQEDLDRLRKAQARGPITDDELAFTAEFLSEVADEKGITPQVIAAAAESAGIPATERGPLNWRWVQALLRIVDPTPLGNFSLDEFTHDVFIYLNSPAIRQAIDAIVAAELREGPCVVVGHSLGSIVGFNVLRACPAATLNLRRYITVGCPLGVRAVQNKLGFPLDAPCITDWFNARDSRDVVALRPLTSDVFPFTPAIRNKNDVNNKTSNRHGIDGYLNDPVVAREIFTALQP